MKSITTVLTTEAVFSDDGLKRYILKKVWDESKPQLAIIMLAPSDASSVSLDNTSMLVLNNSFRLGYGGVTILNLFATLNDFSLRLAEVEDPENLSARRPMQWSMPQVLVKHPAKSFSGDRSRSFWHWPQWKGSSTACVTKLEMQGFNIPSLRQSVHGFFLPSR